MSHRRPVQDDRRALSARPPRTMNAGRSLSAASSWSAPAPPDSPRAPRRRSRCQRHRAQRAPQVGLEILMSGGHALQRHAPRGERSATTSAAHRASSRDVLRAFPADAGPRVAASRSGFALKLEETGKYFPDERLTRTPCSTRWSRAVERARSGSIVAGAQRGADLFALRPRPRFSIGVPATCATARRSSSGVRGQRRLGLALCRQSSPTSGSKPTPSCIATGGLSLPAHGERRRRLRARRRSLGHTIEPPVPAADASLVRLRSAVPR